MWEDFVSNYYLHFELSNYKQEIIFNVIFWDFLLSFMTSFCCNHFTESLTINSTYDSTVLFFLTITTFIHSSNKTFFYNRKVISSGEWIHSIHIHIKYRIDESMTEVTGIFYECMAIVVGLFVWWVWGRRETLCVSCIFLFVYSYI